MAGRDARLPVRAGSEHAIVPTSSVLRHQGRVQGRKDLRVRFNLSPSPTPSAKEAQVEKAWSLAGAAVAADNRLTVVAQPQQLAGRQTADAPDPAS